MNSPRHSFLASLFRALVSRPGAERRMKTLTEDLTLFHCHRARLESESKRRRPVALTRIGNEIHIRP